MNVRNALGIILPIVIFAAMAPAQQPTLAVNNWAKGYQFDCWLNGEPLFSGDDVLFARWSGWPLKPSENVVRVVIKAYSIQPLGSASLDIVTSCNGDEAPVLSVDEIRGGAASVVEKFSWTGAQFVATQSKIREITSTEATTLVSVGLRIVEALASRREDVLNDLSDASKLDLPAWVFQGGVVDEGTGIKRVAKVDDVELIIGKRIALLRPSNRFAAQSGGVGLLRIEQIDKKRAFKLNYVILAYEESGALVVRGRDGVWFRLRHEFFRPAH